MDDQGRGVPVGFLITTEETAEVLAEFLRDLLEGVSIGWEGCGVAGAPCRQQAAGSNVPANCAAHHPALPTLLRCTAHPPALQARQHVPTFKYGKIMVDKAKNEIAAIRLLELAGEADGHLLCYFHFLQEWERFLRSAESGVSGKEAQHRVIVGLAHLVHVRSEEMFTAKVSSRGAPSPRHPPMLMPQPLPAHPPPLAAPSWSLASLSLALHPPTLQLSAWYADVMAYPAVVGKMAEHWAPCARHWAWWGRLDVLDLCANTNNLLERFFGLLKYIHLERNTQHSLQRLVNLLLEKVVPACMLRRRQALAGRGTSSDQRQREQRQQKYIKRMVDGGDVTPAPAGSEPGLTNVRRIDEEDNTIKPLPTCVGDLSCSCKFSGAQRQGWVGSRGLWAASEAAVGGTLTTAAHTVPCPSAATEDEVCTHLKAAAQAIGGFTPGLRTAMAEHLVAGGCIRVDAAHRCSCFAVAHKLRPVVFEPLEGVCSCHDRALHGTCCHLLAAAHLPQFQGMQLPSGPPVPDANVVRKGGCRAGCGQAHWGCRHGMSIAPCPLTPRRPTTSTSGAPSSCPPASR